MKSQSLRWRFVNQVNPAETVLVHDQGSAQTLAMLIQKMGGDWIMQEERPLGMMMPEATAPAAAPPAEANPELPPELHAEPIAEAQISAASPLVAEMSAAPEMPVPAVHAAAPVDLEPLIPAPDKIAMQGEATSTSIPVMSESERAAESITEESHREEESAEDHSAASAAVPSSELPQLQLDGASIAPATIALEGPATPNAVQLEVAAIAAFESHSEVPKSIVPPPAPKKLSVPEKQDGRERRAQQRFMTEFRVILVSGSSSFRTMSLDVSLGGMRLKKAIPASFIKEKCIAYVSHKDLRENIEIVCHVIGDQQDPCRIQFIQPNSAQLKRLNDWLIEHNQGAQARGKAS